MLLQLNSNARRSSAAAAVMLGWRQPAHAHSGEAAAPSGDGNRLSAYLTAACTRSTSLPWRRQRLEGSRGSSKHKCVTTIGGE